MDGNLGLPRINMHCIKKTLDVNNQVTNISNIEHIFCIKDGTKKIKSIINGNIATIHEEGYTENSKVDMWVFCVRSSEGGSICEQIIVPEDEVKYQEWLDSL
jgi:phage terminase large subunit